MSFFNFDYNPRNPRVGDRVIVAGDDSLNQSATEDNRYLDWFTKHKGGEFYISQILDEDSVRLASPLTNSIDDYTWNPNWLEPAPTMLSEGTCVMVPNIYLDERYRSNGNWGDDMDRYTHQPLNIVRRTSGDYFEVYRNGYFWHRDWMFIMPEVQRTAPRTRGGFKVGDTVMVLNTRSFGNKGVITAVGVDHCSVRSSTKPRMSHAFSCSRLMLLARDGKMTYEPNDARLLNEA